MPVCLYKALLAWQNSSAASCFPAFHLGMTGCAGMVWCSCVPGFLPSLLVCVPPCLLTFAAVYVYSTLPSSLWPVPCGNALACTLCIALHLAVCVTWLLSDLVMGHGKLCVMSMCVWYVCLGQWHLGRGCKGLVLHTHTTTTSCLLINIKNKAKRDRRQGKNKKHLCLLLALSLWTKGMAAEKKILPHPPPA